MVAAAVGNAGPFWRGSVTGGERLTAPLTLTLPKLFVVALWFRGMLGKVAGAVAIDAAMVEIPMPPRPVRLTAP